MFGVCLSKSVVAQVVRDTMAHAYFFGDVDSKEAEKALSGRKKGTFLVRMSASHPGQFTISKVVCWLCFVFVSS